MLQRSRDEAVRLEARVERVKAVSEAMNPKLGVSEVATAHPGRGGRGARAAAGGLGVVTPDGRNFEFMSTVGVVEGPPRACRSRPAGRTPTPSGPARS